MVAIPKPSEFQGFQLLDPGQYNVHLSKVEGPERGAYGHIMYFTFKVNDDDEDFAGEEIRQLYGLDSKKLLAAVTALNGGTYDENDDLDFEDLIGNNAIATIENISKKNRDGMDVEYNRITNITAMRRKRRQQEAPAKAARRAQPVDDFDVEDDDFPE